MEFIEWEVIMLLMSSLLVNGFHTAHCPSGLSKDSNVIINGTKCYEFVLHHSTDWVYASADCSKKGGNLVTIENIDQNEFIQRSLESLHFVDKGVWIGLNDRRNEGHYEWIKGNEPANFTNWLPGQPGDFLGFHNEDCVLLMYHSSGQWDDVHCYDQLLSAPEHHGWVCQYDATTTSTESKEQTTVGAVTTATVNCADISDKTCDKSHIHFICNDENLRPFCPMSCGLCGQSTH